MAFPTSALPATVEIAPGADPAGDPGTWSWVDITSNARLRDGIQITQGRADESARVAPSVCRLRLDNRDGNFSPRNPLGAYYGSLGRNTPIRVRLRLNANPFFEVDVSNWTPTNGTFVRSTTQFHQGIASGLLTPNGVGATAEVDCETAAAVAGGTYRASVWVRCAVARNVRLTLDWVGAGQVQQTFAVAANTWTMLEVSGTAPSGTTGAREFVSLDSTPPSAHLLYVDEAMVTVDRFSGFVSSWPLRWDKSGNDATVPIQADGVLRRLGQGTPPDKSPLLRSIIATGPVAYWPCEDGRAATGVASALPGHQPLAITGTPVFTSSDTWETNTIRVGTPSVLDLSAGVSTYATVPSSVTVDTATDWTVTVTVDWDDSISGDLVLFDVHTPGGTYARWQMRLTKGLFTQVVAITAAGVETTVINSISITSSFTFQDLSVWQDGADIRVGINYLHGTGFDRWTSEAAVAGTTSGVTAVAVNPTLVTQGVPLPMGHLTLWASHPIPEPVEGGDRLGAFYSWWRESPTDRLARLCAEDGVPLVLAGTSTSPLMGWQPPAPLADLLQEGADADQGVMYESGFGLGYVPRESRYNRPVALTLDFAQGQVAEPPEPADDDQQLRNRAIVRRRDGSFAIAQDAISIARHGLYEDESTVSHADDTQLADHAAWRVHLGTVDALRWPRIDLNLARATDLIDEWLACGIGSRVTADNPPGQVAGDDIDIIVEGYTEVLGYKDWLVSLNCSPAKPWTVGVLDDDELGKLDTAGSQLAAQFVSGTSTSMSVSTTAGPLWTTDAAEFPFDIEVGGVRLTVTNITGASSPQTFTVTQTPVNGVIKTIPSGTAVSLWQPLVLAL